MRFPQLLSVSVPGVVGAGGDFTVVGGGSLAQRSWRPNWVPCIFAAHHQGADWVQCLGHDRQCWGNGDGAWVDQIGIGQSATAIAMAAD